MADPVKIETKAEAQACLDAGIELGDAKENPTPHGGHYAIVPDGAKLEMLPEPEFPPRREGTVILADTASFMEFWKRQSDAGSYIYGSIDPAQFTAVFDENSKAQPNWREHRALYTLQHSDEWKTWTGRSGKAFDGNEQFAAWLEENLFDILEPEPALFMDIALSVRVRQDQVFGNKVNLNDGNIVLNYTNAVEGTAGGGSLTIPEIFKISIPVFKGLESPKYTIEARFRYRLNSGRLTLRFDLVRPAKVLEQAFKSMLAEIQEKAETVVLFGLPEA
jgi:uncharacterized protein YfdQ (DUF2303 family)